MVEKQSPQQQAAASVDTVPLVSLEKVFQQKNFASCIFAVSLMASSSSSLTSNMFFPPALMIQA
jgi:hypothetical protein